MTVNTPPAGVTVVTPNQIEFLWERYRKSFYGLVAAVAVVMGGYYGFRYYRQAQIDKKWSAFATSCFLDTTYTGDGGFPESLPKANRVMYGPETAVLSLPQDLEKADAAGIERAMASADANEKPYYLLVLAKRAMLAKEWDKADGLLAQIEKDYPTHTLCMKSAYPIQSRLEEKEETDAIDAHKPQKPKLRPAKESLGTIALLRSQLAAAKAFTMPPQFAKPEIPADAPKFRVKLSGEYGEFVIALLDKKAPKHAEEFKKLAAEPEGSFWKGQRVDEVQRPKEMGRFTRQDVSQFHFGYETTKDDNREKWTTTDASKHQVDFEDNDLGQFAGAVYASAGTDGKSCVDRLWVTASDNFNQDGTAVVIGYVVEGLDVVKKVCAAGMSRQDEERGRGRPTENITIESITAVH